MEQPDPRDVAWAIRWSDVLARVRECAVGPATGSVRLSQQDCADLDRGIQLVSRSVPDP